jgi:hypothetical protein
LCTNWRPTWIIELLFPPPLIITKKPTDPSLCDLCTLHSKIISTQLVELIFKYFMDSIHIFFWRNLIPEINCLFYFPFPEIFQPHVSGICREGHSKKISNILSKVLYHKIWSKYLRQTRKKNR